ncbi:FKBP-type peptidyl-prolyl cis-trans isomerase [uncultured archaeon]|nr:FKBP-type peptidyl-prolyl cis-trans isomerase [uncultured archaeon]
MKHKEIDGTKTSKLKSKYFIKGLVIVAIISSIAIIFLGGYLKDTVESGDTVSVDYIGKLQNGTVFDTSIQSEAAKAGLQLRPTYEPLKFTAGAGQMIKGFDDAVIGMKVGDEKTVSIPPELAYGQYNPNAVIVISTDEFNKLIGREPQEGLQVQAKNGALGTIIKVAGGQVTIDFNHELAGKTLEFYIKVISIQKAAKN